MRRMFLLCGVLLLLAAAGLTLWQISAERQIAQRTETLLQQRAQPAVIAQPLPQERKDAPAFATLHIPKLELTLPVQPSCSAAQLELSPCRYAGTAAAADLVIAGHNYAAHFGALHRLQAGDSVTYTALDGATYRYRVTAVEVLGAAAVGEMTQSGADLTLFTCTVGGKNRIAVRCESVA